MDLKCDHMNEPWLQAARPRDTRTDRRPQSETNCVGSENGRRPLIGDELRGLTKPAIRRPRNARNRTAEPWGRGEVSGYQYGTTYKPMRGGSKYKRGGTKYRDEGALSTNEGGLRYNLRVECVERRERTSTEQTKVRVSTCTVLVLCFLWFRDPQGAVLLEGGRGLRRHARSE